MGLDGSEMSVKDWKWRKHISRTSGKEMLAVSYYGALSDPAIIEYFPVTHEGYAGEKARRMVFELSEKSGLIFDMLADESIEMIVRGFDKHSRPPKTIEYKRDGKFFKVTNRSWA